jgi:hypothetical protein
MLLKCPSVAALYEVVHQLECARLQFVHILYERRQSRKLEIARGHKTAPTVRGATMVIQGNACSIWIITRL